MSYLNLTEQFAWKIAGVTHFGVGTVSMTGDVVKSLGVKNKVLVVTDKGMEDTGLIENVTNPLEEANIDFEIWDGCEPEPTRESMEKGASEGSKSKPEAVVAFGGGSVIDSAKVIAQLIALGGEVNDYLPNAAFPQKGLPIVAVPTTSGTGAETTAYSVVATEMEGSNYYAKAFFADPNIVPDAAIVDPMLTVSMPRELTAATGLDALAHCVGSSYTALSNPFTRAVSLQGIRLISKYLRRAVAYPDDLEARINMSYASFIGGAGIQIAGAGEDHALGHVLGSIYKMPHGQACGLALPSTMEYNVLHNSEQMADIAVAMGEDIAGLTPREAAYKAIESVTTLINDVGFSYALKDYENADKNALPVVADWLHSNPWVVPVYQFWTKRTVSKEDAETIAENTWEGKFGEPF
ncbi:iron-containing alcohol dehydrogenase [Natranaerofaba carboxydovora]|uniref:iron-containing alcohol dehydrogenase n=1 Tax=Natranaerofaba carboxydovora TaxID=2742683 RepID=UPI001F12D1F1|nr:iron-containing alcohol dehydrogenase [Natranaerofaba carboxydovora]UMZ74235.1 1,3-propanediol dehydrogenase [Natranaerofaba carboxydovora]